MTHFCYLVVNSKMLLCGRWQEEFDPSGIRRPPEPDCGSINPKHLLTSKGISSSILSIRRQCTLGVNQVQHTTQRLCLAVEGRGNSQMLATRLLTNPSSLTDSHQVESLDADGVKQSRLTADVDGLLIPSERSLRVLHMFKAAAAHIFDLESPDMVNIVGLWRRTLAAGDVGFLGSSRTCLHSSLKSIASNSHPNDPEELAQRHRLRNSLNNQEKPSATSQQFTVHGRRFWAHSKGPRAPEKRAHANASR